MDRLLVGDVGYGKTEIGDPRRVQGRAVGAAGGGAGADDDPRRAARADVRRAPGRLPGAHRDAEPLPVSAADQQRVIAEVAAGKADVVIGTHRLLSDDVQLRRVRPHRGRRGAPLRGEAQGAAQATAARDRRADPHRDADSAHAAPVAGGAARHDADADRAARPVAGPHLRRAVGRRPHRGGHRPGARSWRPGLLRAQPHRDDRRRGRPRAPHRAARAGGRRPRPDARARPRTGHAPSSWAARSMSSSRR